MEVAQKPPQTSYPSIWNTPDEQYVHIGPALQGYLCEVVRPVVCRPEGSTDLRSAGVGSAQVIRIGGHHVLVTAGHNLKDEGVRQVVGLTPGGAIDLKTIRWLDGSRGSLVGSQVELTHQQTGETRAVKIDLALIEITEEEAQYGGFTPITLDQLEDSTLEQGEIVMLVGYPSELYLRPEEENPTPRFMAFPTLGVHGSEWASNWYPGVHQVVRYPDHDTLMFGPTGVVPAKLPNPKGISGCGLWKIPPDDGTLFSFKKLRLVGVQYAWSGPLQLLVGNDIMAALKALALSLPGAREIIRDHGFEID